MRILLAATLAVTAAQGWLTFGNDVRRSSTATSRVGGRAVQLWATHVAGRVVAQPLVVGRTVYVATTTGRVYALGNHGRVLWSVKLGTVSHKCDELAGYGVTSTPAIDLARKTLYIADGRGRLHALDLHTGADRPGWPARMYLDPQQELVWGALTRVGGAIYAGTGSYCDEPMVGKVIRVDTRTRAVTSWVSVTPEHGGGGGIWGWGGLAFSPTRHTLLAATGNAFRGGENVGGAFHEWAGYGEHLVELTPALTVRSSNHPRSVDGSGDLDFAGSPLIVRRRGCPEEVVALNKNGRLYAWKTSAIAAGPAWSIGVSPRTFKTPLVTQAAYSPRQHAIFVAGPWHLVKVDVGRGCRGHIAWSRLLGTYNGLPTVAGGVVWVPIRRRRAMLLGFDARTGTLRFHRPLGTDLYYSGPTVVGGRLYVASYGGSVRAFG